jgi:hypothetical protein
MFGCIRRLGCLFVILVGVALYVTRDSWYDRVRARYDGTGGDVVSSDWEPLSEEAGARGARSVQSLRGTSGPVFVNLRPGELASYVFLSLAKQLPPSAQDARAAVIGERVYVKATISLKDLGGAGALGALGGFMADRDTMQLGGDFEVLRPGVAQFRVREIRLRDFPVPAAMIPRLVKQFRRGEVPEGVAGDALPLRIPEHIGDVRIAKGRITLYRTSR